MEMVKYKILQQDVEDNGNVEIPKGAIPFNVYMDARGKAVLAFYMPYNKWAELFPGEYAMELKAEQSTKVSASGQVVDMPKENTPDGS